ncbi:MAG: hypothetical protein HKO95_06970 [Rhodobacteraceae bacterium]|nr:hypothetical protein [Alphaproteobacteria bacterium]NNK66461.1 hypothetical protein [Paracoccaceae bacterium]
MSRVKKQFDPSLPVKASSQQGSDLVEENEKTLTGAEKKDLMRRTADDLRDVLTRLADR